VIFEIYRCVEDKCQEKEEQVVQRKLEDKRNLVKVNQNSFSNTE
jgi:hypothetical protein